MNAFKIDFIFRKQKAGAQASFLLPASSLWFSVGLLPRDFPYNHRILVYYREGTSEIRVGQGFSLGYTPESSGK